MPNVLVVDDSRVERHIVGNLLDQAGLTAAYATNGKEALAALAEELPALVLTDLQMPEMDGLELVKQIRKRYPATPVILMTAHGSEEIAVAALQNGAASYVAKKNLSKVLVETVRDCLAVVNARRDQFLALGCLTESEHHFVLGNERSAIGPLVSYLQRIMRHMNFCDEADLVRIGTALHEALLNAIEHGNLELSSDLRENDDETYRRLANERLQQPPYQDRRVFISANMGEKEAVFVVRDEGPGFDSTKLPDPTAPSNLERVSGRGLLLIRTFMDEFHHNSIGNEITLVKSCKSRLLQSP